jgi:hypothetical protein
MRAIMDVDLLGNHSSSEANENDNAISTDETTRLVGLREQSIASN